MKKNIEEIFNESIDEIKKKKKTTSIPMYDGCDGMSENIIKLSKKDINESLDKAFNNVLNKHKIEESSNLFMSKLNEEDYNDYLNTHYTGDDGDIEASKHEKKGEYILKILNNFGYLPKINMSNQAFNILNKIDETEPTLLSIIVPYIKNILNKELQNTQRTIEHINKEF